MASERFAAEFQAQMAERKKRWPRYATMFIEDCILEAIDRWVLTGTDVGDFVTAVLKNDLCEAVGRADDNNLMHLHSLVRYIYNECPSACWDGRGCGQMEKWRERGGQMRYDPMTGDARPEEKACGS